MMKNFAAMPAAAYRRLIGEAMTLEHGGETRELRGAFSTKYAEALAPDMTPIAVQRDLALVAASDLAGLPRSGATLTRATGERYTVRDTQPDGAGSARLVLDRA